MCKGCGSKVTPEMVRRGIVGVSKALLHIDRPTEDVIKARRDACRNCEFSTKNEKFINNPSKGLTSLSQCQQCRCFIHLKTEVGAERCPLGLW